MKEKVADWVTHSGYPLEMYVAQSFRQAEFAAYQGEYYEDSEGPREIDVVGAEVRSTKWGLLRFLFYIECKASRDKPWLLFVGEAHGYYASKERIAWGPANKIGRLMRRLLATSGGIEIFPLFRSVSHPAYGVVQSLRKSDGGDASYAATMQVCKAAASLSKDADAGEQAQVWDREAVIGFPVIVVDGILYTAKLVGDDLLLDEVEQYELLVRNPGLGPPTLVTVVTKKGLPDFVLRARATVDGIVAWCGRNGEEAERAFRRLGRSE